MKRTPERVLELPDDCARCRRLADFLREARKTHPEYHARPVPPFGDRDARLLVVGLAPGFHGANRTGRPFTGDYAGVMLYATLHRFGFASSDRSISADDGLRLRSCRITNAVKCVPPQNKPDSTEIRECNDYLASELAQLRAGVAVLALGLIAHRAVLMALELRVAAYEFAHGATHDLPNGLRLFDSYHCSRYNTQTRRLTQPMFDEVFVAITRHLGCR